MNIKRKTRILHYQVHIFFTHSPSAEGIKKKRPIGKSLKREKKRELKKKEIGRKRVE